MPESATRPRYLEGYPRLDMLRVKAAADDGGKICWFVDQRGMTHGLARLKDITDRHITIEYEITLPYLPARHGSIRLDRVYAPGDGAMHRLMTNCPRCAKPKIVLVYAETWACSHCHRLPYRSQTMDYHTRSFERREELRMIVKRGRPKGMHNKSFLKVRAELKEISKRLNNISERTSNRDQNIIISSRWNDENASPGLWFVSKMERDNY